MLGKLVKRLPKKLVAGPAAEHGHRASAAAGDGRNAAEVLHLVGAIEALTIGAEGRQESRRQGIAGSWSCIARLRTKSRPLSTRAGSVVRGVAAAMRSKRSSILACPKLCRRYS